MPIAKMKNISFWNILCDILLCSKVNKNNGESGYLKEYEMLFLK